MRVKSIAPFDLVLYFVSFATGSWLTKMLVVASVSNFLLFFGWDILLRMRSGRGKWCERSTGSRYGMTLSTAASSAAPPRKVILAWSSAIAPRVSALRAIAWSTCTATRIENNRDQKISFRFVPIKKFGGLVRGMTPCAMATSWASQSTDCWLGSVRKQTHGRNH